MKAVVFLGGGRITGALVAGLRLAGDRRRIIVYDRNRGKVGALRRESQVEVARDLKSAMKQAEMLIVAVRPASVAGMLQEVVASGAQAPRVCVSLAAGIPLEKLRGKIGGRVRWVRAMPSPVSRIGRGLTALCFERGMSRTDRKVVRDLFLRVGAVIEIRENEFDAFTATYSSSHGYHVLATLARAAQESGLGRESAFIAAAHALSDGIEYWRESGESVEALLEEAATPGGIAAATMAAMDRAGYARVVAMGLRAGIRQAKKNARGV